MSTFTERSQEWLSGHRLDSPMFVDSAKPIAENTDGTIRTELDAQIRMTHTLLEILNELRRMNNTPRDSSSVSSCEIKFLAPTKDHPEGKPQPVIKAYAGSEVPVDAAIEAYGRAFLMSQQGALEGWEQTLDVLQVERATLNTASSGMYSPGLGPRA